jgi:integration host factor subunit beta
VLKTDLVQRVIDSNPHIRSGNAEKVVRTVIEEIAAALARSDRVELRDIGAFSVRVWQGRLGRNPKTGTDVAVPQKLHPHFRPGKGRENLTRTVQRRTML